MKDKYIFTFVRHPYQRIISWFYYHKNTEPYRSQSLNEWISNGCQTHWTIQNKTNWKKENLSPILQYNFIDGNSEIIWDFVIYKTNPGFCDNKIES